ncbi:hypothetical protein [Acrocarpospora sp. B8E8]|uniref:hypothetical protein n=1 Tax=Acrocarpospora sp. B8E8 TaxID=3153572 RepID=UPI00325F9CB4
MAATYRPTDEQIRDNYAHRAIRALAGRANASSSFKVLRNPAIVRGGSVTSFDAALVFFHQQLSSTSSTEHCPAIENHST